MIRNRVQPFQPIFLFSWPRLAMLLRLRPDSMIRAPCAWLLPSLRGRDEALSQGCG